MKFAGIQADVAFADPKSNLKLLHEHLVEEAENGTDVVVFPECFLTGYCFQSLEEARTVAEPLDGSSVTQVIEWCRELNIAAVFGFLESAGESVFNAAVMVGPEGLVGHYRKIHLPFLGVDRFTTPGDRPLEVFEYQGVRIGILICYDGGFPEAPRVLAIQGADIVLLPTNWPPGAETMAEYAINCRAMESAIYFASVNRVGVERGFSFIGYSRAADVGGLTIDTLDHRQPGIIRWEVDPQKAREKQIVRVPGQHVIDRMADRRPEVYGPICDGHSLPRPGRT